MKSKTRITTITITKVALSTAIICILGPLSFSIPISPVPISLGILGIFFAVYVNGWLWGTVSCVLYLLLGFVGVPVFTGFTGGITKLLGPTGGYMIGYIFLSLIAGFFISKFENKIPLHILGSCGRGDSVYPCGCGQNGDSGSDRNTGSKGDKKDEHRFGIGTLKGL